MGALIVFAAVCVHLIAGTLRRKTQVEPAIFGNLGPLLLPSGSELGVTIWVRCRYKKTKRGEIQSKCFILIVPVDFHAELS
ncbi:hypothetical protein KC221_26935, partial [Mycobacterium tuberculosis]|nr:hypothetical protein [Mycobacterium tuberculosis]